MQQAPQAAALQWCAFNSYNRFSSVVLDFVLHDSLLISHAASKFVEGRAEPAFVT
jgi:hypothetical protein